MRYTFLDAGHGTKVNRARFAGVAQTPRLVVALSNLARDRVSLFAQFDQLGIAALTGLHQYIASQAGVLRDAPDLLDNRRFDLGCRQRGRRTILSPPLNRGQASVVAVRLRATAGDVVNH